MTSQVLPLTLANLSVKSRLLALVVLAMFCGLVVVGGCKPKGNAEAATPVQAVQGPVANADEAELPTPPPAAAPTEKARAVAAPSLKEEAAAGGNGTIAGGWVNAGGACDSGASVFFNPDGTYMSEGERGTWALSGKTLTVTTATTFDEGASTTQGPDESTGDSGEKSVLTLLSVTDDAARVVLSNGSNANWTRCNS